MASFDHAGLGPAEIAAVAAAMRADPALAEELELIAGALAADKRRRFWHAFAHELPRRRRPAAAVLPALERVCGREGEPGPPGH